MHNLLRIAPEVFRRGKKSIKSILTLLLLSLLFICIPIFSQSPNSTYPIIFIHGINDNNIHCWSKDGSDNDVLDYLEKAGLSNGGNLDVTLCYSRYADSLNVPKEQDVHLFTKNPPAGDYYTVNFDVDASGNIPVNNRCVLTIDMIEEEVSELNTSDSVALIFSMEDIICIDDEYMQVIDMMDNVFGGKTITFKRGALGSTITSHKKGLVTDNFVWNLSNESNQASIAKQGYGLKLVIDAIKAKTGADKVILVGHSMGGLAAREYIRTYYRNDIAKLVTIGTPHLGSNVSDIDPTNLINCYGVGVDVRSDAIRDLMYNYTGGNGNPTPPYPSPLDAGAYLFGDFEANIPNDFYSWDVNANGKKDGTIIPGLNFSIISLPSSINYCWIVSEIDNWGPNIFGDGVVRTLRQFPWFNYDTVGNPLIERGDTLMTDKFHNDEPKDCNSLIRGLDEPNTYENAYLLTPANNKLLSFHRTIKGFITYQPYHNPLDVDFFKIEIPLGGNLNIEVLNVSFSNGNLALLDSNRHPFGSQVHTPAPLILNNQIPSGTYYIRIFGDANDSSWQYPYTLSVDFSSAPVLLSPANGATNQPLSATLTWNQVGDSTISCHVQVAKTSEFVNHLPPYDKLVIIDTIVASLSIDIGPLSKDTTYYWRVTAKNASGESSWSEVWSFSTIPSIPGAPLLISPDNNAMDQPLSLTLNWTNGSGGLPAMYSLQVSSTPDFTNLIFDQGNLTSPSQQVSGLANLTTYYWRVKSSNISGTSEWSDFWSFTTFDNTAPPIPSSDISLLEYFFDTDPGFGYGTAISATPDSQIDLTRSINLSNLSVGYHRCYFRAKDANGRWGIPQERDVYVQSTPVDLQHGIVLNGMEYFFDTDPGFGNGIKTTFSPSDTLVDLSSNIDLSNLSLGYHRFYIRAQDTSGRWGIPQARDVYVQSLAGDSLDLQHGMVLNGMEYFFDTDPGFGNGVQISISPDTVIDLNRVIDLSELSTGYHRLYFRAKDTSGQWGIPQEKDIFVQSGNGDLQHGTVLNAMEYFFDTDPGFGNGISLSVTPGDTIDITRNINLSGLSYGDHTLYVRARDSLGFWGIPQAKTISVIIPQVTLLTPALNSNISDLNIFFSWSSGIIADSFDLIVDDNQDFSSPEVSKKQISALNGYTQTEYALNDVRGWLADGSYYWKVIAYKNGIAYPSDVGVFTYTTVKQSAPIWGPVLRAYNGHDKDHFYCTQQQQQATAIPQGYRAEKPQGFVSVLPFNDLSNPDVVPIFRLYNGVIAPVTARCHLYTINTAEKDSCIAHGWLYEGIIGFTYKNFHPGLVALYHLYLTKSDSTVRDHFYTINEFERLNAISQYGFKDKGILAYVSPTGNNSTVPYSLNGPSVGSGADPFNGNLSHWETGSFSIPEGRMSLDFSHQYSSISVLLKTPVRCLGPGWSHTYSACLTTDDGIIKIFWPGGGFHEYDYSSCRRLSQGIYDSLTRISDTVYQLRTKDQIVYRFAMLHKADSLAVLVSISDRNNNTIQCVHDTNGNLCSVVGPKGRALTFAYYERQDSEFLIKSVTDPSGRVVSFAYDTAGRLIAYINAKGDTTHYAYDLRWPCEHLLDTVTQPEGNIIVNEYDTAISANATRRLVSQNYSVAGSPVQSVRLDYSNADFVKVLDSRNKEFDFYYKPQKDGIIQKLCTPAGRASYEYGDSVLNPISPTKITDGMGYVTMVSYDDRGNALQLLKPYGILHTFSYTALNDLARYIGPRNDTTVYNYDPNGNLTGVKNYRGLTTVAYRSDGLIDSVIDPLGNRTRLSYNSYGNTNGILDPLNNYWQYTYDNASRLIGSQNPKGQISHTDYSSTDLVTSTTGAINDTTGYLYDRNGRLTTIQNAKNNNTVLGYNSLNMLDSIKNPLGNTVRFGYTGTLLTKKTMASGDTLGFTYDDKGRIQSFAGAAQASFEYDSNDNVVRVTEQSKQMTFGYDSLNRLTWYVDYYGDRVGYAWDKAGNLDHIVYPDGNTVYYEYYPDNLLYRVTDWRGNITTYFYRDDGSLDYIRYPNGVRCFYVYDKAGRVTGLANVKTNGDTINGYSFTLDALGNITSEARKEPYDNPKIQAENTACSYDAANQITQAGNVTFTHDNNGNMIGRLGNGVNTAYGFDPLNRLLYVDSNGVRKDTFAYDIYGNRGSATRNGNTVRYVLDIAGSMSNVLMEKDGSGAPVYYYIYGLGMVYRMKTDGYVEYYHYDLRGSTVAMTDGNQAITHKYAYGTYGGILADSGAQDNDFKFVGKYGVMDEGNGIYFMRARYYDARIGRFLSEDPVWGVNLYGYSKDNPILHVDPLGENAWEAVLSFTKTAIDILTKVTEGFIGGFSKEVSPGGSDAMGVVLEGTKPVFDAEVILINNRDQIKEWMKYQGETFLEDNGYDATAEYLNNLTSIRGGEKRKKAIKEYIKKTYPGYSD